MTRGYSESSYFVHKTLGYWQLPAGGWWADCWLPWTLRCVSVSAKWRWTRDGELEILIYTIVQTII